MGLTLRGVVCIALSSVVAGACSAPRTPLLTYTVEPGASSTGGLIEGTIALSPNSRCIELLVGNGAPVGLVWPVGYSATFEPLRIYDEAGMEVATGGLNVTIGGDMLLRPSAECRTSKSFLVSRITPGVIPIAT